MLPEQQTSSAPLWVGLNAKSRVGLCLKRRTPEPLVLASASPRRQEIMRLLDYPFVVRPGEADETLLPGEEPASAARRLAELKARAVEAQERYVIGADTLVVNGTIILGKPADAAEAEAMLRRLRGRQHAVVTGVAVLDRATDRTTTGALTTEVWMRDYADAEIAAYIAAGEPFDKAGGYAIQDPIFRPVARTRGCYLNVIGLPLCLLLYLLWQAGVPVPPPDRQRSGFLCPGCVFST